MDRYILIAINRCRNASHYTMGEDEQMNTENKGLNLNSEELNNLLDCIEDGIFLIDKNGIIVGLNKVSAELTNVPKKDMIGRNVYELINKGVFDAEETCSIEALESGKTVSKIQQGIKGQRNILSTATPYKVKGNTEYVIVTERDISNISRLKSKLDKQIESMRKYQAEIVHYRNQNLSFGDVIFKSEVMQKLVTTAVRIASNDASVLIQGESGTGKEVIANLIQKNSHRSEQPYIKINCSTIPENLIESEFYGYEKGAFTGALEKGKLGFFELADKGTLFLDEIDTMPISMQSKLLRVLQENEFFRVGGSKMKKVDVRIIAATNSNLKKLIETEKFRKDLFYRLNVIPLKVPGLKDRADDIIPLAEFFLDKFNKKYSYSKSLDISAIKVLTHYSWPGNVRELENFIERLVVSIEEDNITGNIIESLHLFPI